MYSFIDFFINSIKLCHSVYIICMQPIKCFRYALKQYIKSIEFSRTFCDLNQKFVTFRVNNRNFTNQSRSHMLKIYETFSCYNTGLDFFNFLTLPNVEKWKNPAMHIVICIFHIFIIKIFFQQNQPIRDSIRFKFGMNVSMWTVHICIRVVHTYLQKTRLFVIFDLVKIFSVGFLFLVAFDVNFFISEKNHSRQ